MCSRYRRIAVRVLSLLLVVSALLVPMTASAGDWDKEKGSMDVPAGATEEYRLEVAGISVTIPVGAMPEGGKVMLQVKSSSDGEFVADFLPNPDFAQAVMMDFGTAEVVYLGQGRNLAQIWTSDLDGDGAVGEILSDHFSRYSGHY